MTHAPFIPLREAKNRDVGCQGQLKGNPGVVSADRIRRFHIQETEVCTESCPEGTGLRLPTCHQLASNGSCYLVLQLGERVACKTDTPLLGSDAHQVDAAAQVSSATR